LQVLVAGGMVGQKLVLEEVVLGVIVLLRAMQLVQPPQYLSQLVLEEQHKPVVVIPFLAQSHLLVVVEEIFGVALLIMVALVAALLEQIHLRVRGLLVRVMAVHMALLEQLVVHLLMEVVAGEQGLREHRAMAMLLVFQAQLVVLL
jgi:hypothetical protein